MGTTPPQTWGPRCFVAAWDATTMFAINPLVDTIDFDWGDLEWEFKPNIAGGRAGTQKPEEDTMITFEGTFVSIGNVTTSEPSGLIAKYYGGTDTAPPYSVDNYAAGQERDSWQLFFMWTDDSTVTHATAAVVSGSNALRYRVIEARLVSMKDKFTPGEKPIFTFKFRVPARTISGARTITKESTGGIFSGDWATMASLATVTVG